MIRRRGQNPNHEDSSSSDEEDAFSALSRKHSSKRAKLKPERNGAGSATPPVTFKPVDKMDILGALDPASKLSVKEAAALSNSKTILPSTNQPSSRLPISVTSSMKRHHKPSDTRKAKMEALLQELEAENISRKPQDLHRFVPEKKGSFVEPGEEKLTSNLFVGNLAPSITEEDLSNLFSQFGDLYSIKIMWPRTVEERKRCRNTGFVCFMNREDAEEALEACNDTDPFNVGRLLTMRWGKNVKKNVRRGTGGLVEAAMRNREGEPKTPKTPSTNTGYPSGFGDLAGKLRPDGLPHVIMLGDPEMQDISQAKPYDPKIHSTGAIRVETPKDETRFHFISTVASYVAKDGIEIEKRLLEEESGNSLFNFLTLDNADERQRKENLFYRWRVFSFSQGDSYSIWRTEPFVMFHPNGRYWIPPPLNLDAVKREKALAKEGKDRYRQEKEDRVNSQQYTTGRQVERARYLRRKGRGQYGENASKLSPEDLLEFDRLVKKELSISREKICKAMAFCFDKCLAAKDISALLKETLLDDSHHVTIDMRIARLYLLSDILFNSQQPGIKNAFMYRSTIEAMAPEIFRSLGKYRESSIGRMTINKMRRAVSAVLCAWTDWGVYNVTFMDELEAHYEGREVKHDTGIDVEGSAPVEEDTKMSDPLDQSEEEGQFITSGPRGDWVEVTDMTDKGSSELVAKEFPPSKREGKSLSGDCISPGAGNVNHASVAGTDPKNVSSEVFEDVDGEPIEEADADIDGEPIDMDHVEANVDGEALDGDALDGEDLDGDAIDEGDVDGEEIDGDDL